MTRQEAELRGIYCKTETCTGPGQWFYCDPDDGWTKDFFTRKIIEHSRQICEDFLFMMEPVRVMNLLLEREGKDKIIYDEYGNAIAWWDSYEKYEFPLFTVQENSCSVRYEKTNITPEKAKELGITLIDWKDLEKRNPGEVYYILDDKKDEFITKCTILKYFCYNNI